MFVHRPGGLDRILLGHECYALVPAGQAGMVPSESACRLVPLNGSEMLKQAS